MRGLGLHMKLRESLLRECARVALEQRGFTVELISGAGIVRGARLRAVKGSQERNIAVRTSLDREVGLMRRPNGHWATIPRMDEVIVVAPSEDESGSAEVLSFAPDAIIRVFDAALEARQKENPNFSPKAPIFMALDAASGGRYAVVDSGLKTKAQWQILVPLASVPRHRLSQTESAVGFIERVRQEFADLHGVDVSKVTVEFRITS
jgi:hypothetical protein